MAIINLRDYYPFYTSDCFMEVSEEVAEMFKEFDRKEAAYRLRTYRHKAYYSLDRDDGLEHEAVFVSLSPHELYERLSLIHILIFERLTEQEKEIYNVMLQLKGNKPYLWEGIYEGGTDPEPDYEIPGEALNDPAFAALMKDCLLYTSRCV